MTPVQPVTFTSTARAACFGDPASALHGLRRLARERPESGLVWLLLGTAYRRLGRGRDARRALGIARARLRDEPEVDYELGLSLVDDGRPGEAEWYLRSAISRDPSEPRYRMGLALAALASGHPQRAEKYVRTILAEPDCPPLLADACRSIRSAASRLLSGPVPRV